MKRVYDLILERILPPSTPHRCECGEELIVNENLTSVECQNPECKVHGSKKLIDLLNILGISAGIGENNSQEIMDILGISNPVDIFKVDFSNITKPSKYFVVLTNLEKSIHKIKSEGIEFYKFMNLFFFKHLGITRSKDLFSGITSPQDFFREYPNEILINEYVSKRLNIMPYRDTVVMITDDLFNNKEYILDIASNLKFKESISGEIFYIAMTGPILYARDDNGLNFSNRDKFPEFVSRKYGINIQATKINSNKTRYLIMDSNMMSNSKYRKAQKYGIEVVNSLEFIGIIENYIERQNSNNKEVHNKLDCNVDPYEYNNKYEGDIDLNKISDIDDKNEINNILNWGD